nr:hypothetical protein CFP56_65296 [Quercus suber]
MVGIEDRINFDGPVVMPMEVNSSCFDGSSFNSLAVARLEVGISSDGLAVAPMEVNCNFSVGFNFYGLAVAQMELNCSSFNEFSFDDFAVALGKTNMANSQLSKGIFLPSILKRLSVVGFVDFGVNSVNKIGSESSVLLI